MTFISSECAVRHVLLMWRRYRGVYRTWLDRLWQLSPSYPSLSPAVSTEYSIVVIKSTKPLNSCMCCDRRLIPSHLTNYLRVLWSVDLYRWGCGNPWWVGRNHGKVHTSRGGGEAEEFYYLHTHHRTPDIVQADGIDHRLPHSAVPGAFALYKIAF